MNPLISDGAVRLGSVLALVLWLGGVTIGVLGLILPYQRPRPRAVAPAPVRANLVEVEMDPVPSLPPDAGPAWAAAPVPSPTPALPTISKAAPWLTVAEPLPATPVARPIDGATGRVAVAQAGLMRLPPSVVVPPKRTPKRTLTPGSSEGHQPAPYYPVEAVRARQEGTVGIGFTVREDGGVLQAEVVAPSPWPLLNEAALHTVRRHWRLAPGTSRRYEVSIRFQLHE